MDLNEYILRDIFCIRAITNDGIRDLEYMSVISVDQLTKCSWIASPNSHHEFFIFDVTLPPPAYIDACMIITPCTF